MNGINGAALAAESVVSLKQSDVQSSSMVTANSVHYESGEESQQWDDALAVASLVEQQDGSDNTSAFLLTEYVADSEPLEATILTTLLDSQKQYAHLQVADKTEYTTRVANKDGGVQGPFNTVAGTPSSADALALHSITDVEYLILDGADVTRPFTSSGESTESAKPHNVVQSISASTMHTAVSSSHPYDRGMHGGRPDDLFAGSVSLITAQAYENSDTPLTTDSFAAGRSMLKQDVMSSMNLTSQMPYRQSDLILSSTQNVTLPVTSETLIDDIQQASSVSSSSLTPRTQNHSSSTNHWFSAELDTSHHKWGQDLVSLLRDKVSLQLGQQMNRAEIRLDPPQLGAIEMVIEVDGETTRVQLSASNPMIREAMTQNLEQLRQQLLQGQSSSQLDVDVKGNGEQQHQENTDEKALANFTDDTAEEEKSDVSSAWLNRTL